MRHHFETEKSCADTLKSDLDHAEHKENLKRGDSGIGLGVTHEQLVMLEQDRKELIERVVILVL